MKNKSITIPNPSDKLEAAIIEKMEASKLSRTAAATALFEASLDKPNAINDNTLNELKAAQEKIKDLEKKLVSKPTGNLDALEKEISLLKKANAFLINQKEDLFNYLKKFAFGINVSELKKTFGANE